MKQRIKHIDKSHCFLKDILVLAYLVYIFILKLWIYLLYIFYFSRLIFYQVSLMAQW